ncbi:aminoglycoside phosphotransferase family protein [Ochrobactrum sp. SFR4]|uniref:aminoglycoside phosphotransferase family protein n=1 Tax=Ochrobactrum sp. SFR4 TaxID=2717368 RepID=UPI001C8BD059|nr:aminoglycoside phosphotransferase family protein [Ochrobactrum sp. SFR4]MBX8824793.1 aminoglycoside phosphotransferase family protein [Ochrobactrum sp. SFR4]
MHANKIKTDLTLIQRLIASQFPQWQNLPLKEVFSAGTDNSMYRLGDDLVVRLPQRPEAAVQILKEQRWLPVIAPHLHCEIPLPLANGVPATDFPYPWSVCQWREGKNAIEATVSDFHQAAVTLACFINDLQSLNATDGPVPGEHNFYRGVPLQNRNEQYLTALDQIHDMINTKAALSLWQQALKADEWRYAPVWIHGDIHAGNLLVRNGRISAVIDFGGLGVGDPACDMMVAWNFLTTDSRAVFREAVKADDAAWKRAQGWALSMAVIALPYYRNTNPQVVRSSLNTIEQLLADL